MGNALFPVGRLILTVGFFLLGVVFGGFYTTAIWRLAVGEGFRRPPYCPACGVAIRLRYQVPVVGFLLSRRRCRSCGAAISIRYPLMEFFTGVLFALVAGVGVDPGLGRRLLIVSLALLAGGTDLLVRRVPNRLLLAGIPAALWAVGLVGLKEAFMGATLLGGLLLLNRVISGGGLGAGDVKLGALFGFLLGPVGAFLAFATANAIAAMAVFIGGVKMRKRWSRNGLPLVPFLGGGALVVAVLPLFLGR